MFAKTVDNVPRVSGESDGDQGLKCRTNGPWCDVRVVAAQHAALLEPADTRERAGFSQPHPGRQLFIGQPRILLQQAYEFEIDAVE